MKYGHFNKILYMRILSELSRKKIDRSKRRYVNKKK